jgi:hypothetical protein
MGEELSGWKVDKMVMKLTFWGGGRVSLCSHAGLEHIIFLPQLLKFWDYRHAPPHGSETCIMKHKLPAVYIESRLQAQTSLKVAVL